MSDSQRNRGRIEARPRLMYLITEDWFFHSHFLPMARAAAQAGYEITVAARLRAHDEELRSKGFRVVPIELDRRGLNFLALFRDLVKVFRLLRQERPDILHCIAMKPIIAAAFVTAVGRRPTTIFALTGFGHLAVNRSLSARFARAVLSTTLALRLRQSRSRLLVENPDDPQAIGRFLPVPAERVTIVGGAGVDPERYPVTDPPKRQTVVAVLVARMLWSKGIDLAVEAVRRVRARGTPLELRLVGAPDLANPRAFSEQTLREWSLEPGITWVGPTSDVAAVWRDADIAIQPSRGGEGLPRAILEAAACGRPIVTTDVPGCRFFVRDGIEGRVVPPEEVDALSDALNELAVAPDLRARMGRAARERVLASFTESRVCADVCRLYEDLLKETVLSRCDPVRGLATAELELIGSSQDDCQVSSTLSGRQ